jgi:2-dehydro-3-deoxyglucarate aldolase/4-hydroxy-2-oxoheptanedioate aldolase
MRANPVKQKLARGERVFGTSVFEFSSPGLPAILANAGAEFALYDMEHSGLGMDDMKTQFALCRGAGIVPFVRPPAKQYHLLSLLLDLGAMGLMLPMVESREEAERIVSWTRYPPEGVRGAIFTGAHDDYAGGDVAAKMKAAHERTLIMALIETKKGLENVDEIVATPGIDVAHLGHFDLSLSLGMPAGFERPEMQAAFDRIVAACAKHGKTAACLAGSVEQGRDWLKRGYRMISYSGDIWILADGLSRGIRGLKEA